MSTTVLGSYTFLEAPDVNGNVILVNDGTVPILSAGELPAANFPILTGDITTAGGSLATTLATVNSNVGSFGSASVVPVVTVNAKGLVTAVSTANIPGSIVQGLLSARPAAGTAGAKRPSPLMIRPNAFGRSSPARTKRRSLPGQICATP